ncbi:MAG TPA: hypothetical protein VH743_19035, partial [Beijerinckiaceae bacterium]
NPDRLERTMKMKLTWVTRQDGGWPRLHLVNLTDVRTVGVYVIWHGGSPPNVVRVGQGAICDRVGCHKTDDKILAYAGLGTLYVTWAAVPAAQLDGVERFLADRLSPRVGDRFPQVPAIPVNLPGAA